MKRRLFRTVIVAALSAALVSPALSAAAHADHWRHAHGPGYWQAQDWRAKQRVVRKWRRHHARHRHETGYVVRHYPHRPHRDGSQTLSGNALIGGLLGAMLGAAAGTQVGKGSGRDVAIIGGGVLGALIGGSLGQSMDRNDQYRVNSALETSRTGQTIVWRNPNTGGAYRVTPTRTYQVARNAYCREFETWGMIGGYEEKMYGTACRQPDGSWKPVR